MRSCTVCIPSPWAHPIPTAGIPRTAAALASVEPAPNASAEPQRPPRREHGAHQRMVGRDLAGAAAPHHLALE